MLILQNRGIQDYKICSCISVQPSEPEGVTLTQQNRGGSHFKGPSTWPRRLLWQGCSGPLYLHNRSAGFGRPDLDFKRVRKHLQQNISPPPRICSGCYQVSLLRYKTSGVYVSTQVTGITNLKHVSSSVWFFYVIKENYISLSVVKFEITNTSLKLFGPFIEVNRTLVFGEEKISLSVL